MNPFLAALSFLAGAALTWLWTVRTVTREVPLARGAVVDDSDEVTTGIPEVIPAASAASVSPGESAPQPSVAPAGAAQPPSYGPTAAEASDDTPAGDVVYRPPNVTGNQASRAVGLADPLVGSGTRVDAPGQSEPDGVPTLDGESAAAAANVPSPGPSKDSAAAPTEVVRPDGMTVKGDRRAHLYLVPADEDFWRAKPDIWFRDEDDAKQAGFAHYVRVPRPQQGAVESAALASPNPAVQPALPGEDTTRIDTAGIDTAKGSEAKLWGPPSPES
jgi:hypothetical protein